MQATKHAKVASQSLVLLLQATKHPYSSLSSLSSISLHHPHLSPAATSLSLQEQPACGRDLLHYLLISTMPKSVIVEDIDKSVDLSNCNKKKKGGGSGADEETAA